ncbi:MAG: YraN family protein [Rickettsiales bacterium]|nr:YraN family protein [Rickettsiales bacterium]
MQKKKTLKHKKAYNFGIIAERIVLCFLRLKGYKILFWRYKTHFGEIDIIAKKGKMIAIIEVKARKSKVLIEEILSPRQVHRIKNAVESFLMRNPKFRACRIRFDFVFVGRFFTIRHYKDFL